MTASITAQSQKQYAAFRWRIIAFVLDLLIMGGGIMAVIFLIFGVEWLHGEWWYSPEIGIGCLMWSVANLLCWVNGQGQTPGKLIVHLRIIRCDTGEAIDYGAALLRFVIGYGALFLTGGLGLLLAFWRKDRRALHDLIAGTCVLREEA